MHASMTAHILSLLLVLWSDVIFYTRCEMSLEKGHRVSIPFPLNAKVMTL